ncbi:alpha/beta hydrolase [Chamaesiphon sp. VAR_69_metabat_338]|uniref:alpha/beta fold hydrolase n=1 Tax=Chamaesiphon sp. VAR_69_metabat_338 TaxID=2964704 RepID=UPI00286D78B5|nr:alpha/beta hydrolase [Chamaesiphon sp. VAR_69_metabat_338]
MVDLSSRIKLSTGQIFWHEAGDARRPAVVFLHGSWHDSNQWQEIVRHVGAHFHCLAPDLLGFGNSISSHTPTSIEMEVAHLHEFLSKLKLHPVYFVGHSLGAWIAVSYTLKYPDLVRGVVAISPEGFSLNGWQKYSLSTKLLLAHPLLFKLWLKSLAATISISDGAHPLVKSQSYWQFANKFPTTRHLLFERSTHQIRQELVADCLSQFRSPLLVLQIDKDDRFTIEQSQDYVRSVQKSEYKSLRVSEVDSPDLDRQIAREIQAFVERAQLKIDREEVELW